MQLLSTLMENTEEDYSSMDLSSTSSAASSLFSDLSVASTVSSGGGSGEITTAEIFPAREKCVGRRNKAVTWGTTSVIGRRREMEDAVAVVPGFVTSTCRHVGGCAAVESGEASPVHFFGVFDGHGGSQGCATYP